MNGSEDTKNILGRRETFDTIKASDILSLRRK